MAKQTIFLGTIPNDNTGTDLRSGGNIINDNFTELYAAVFLPSTRFESAAFTISDADKNGYIRYTGATDISVTYPNSISVEAVTTFFQAGAGIITLVGDTGVVLNGNVKTAGQNTAMQTKKVADNLVDVIGGVE